MASVLGISSGFKFAKKSAKSATSVTTSNNSAKSATSVTTSNNSCCCPSTTLFLQTLTDKLYDMALSLQQQFIDLTNFKNNTSQRGRGAIIASIDVQATVSVKMEYVYYIQRYGPPLKGIFDPIYLDLIRAEIAAGTIS